MARGISLKVGPFSSRFLAAWHALETREGRKLSATELAGRIGVSSGLISQWMDPATNVPPQARVLAIASVCEVDPGWLAFGEATAAPPPRADDIDRTKPAGKVRRHVVTPESEAAKKTKRRGA